LRKTLYFYFYRRTASVSLARVLSGAAYLLHELVYSLKRARLRGDMITQSHTDAFAHVSALHPKPQSRTSVVNPLLDPDVDLTIVIPAYNAQDFLGDCLDSVLNQDTKYSYDVVVVDDGSTDATPQILAGYEEQATIRLISQAHFGVSSARNTGIDSATGKYLMFVDSDDVVDREIVSSLLDEAYRTGHDIVECGYYLFDAVGNRRLFIDRRIDIKANDRRSIMNYDGYLWGKVYRRPLFDRVRLPVGYWFEDTLTHFILFRLCDGFSYCPKALYGHRVNLQGLTQTFSRSTRCLDAYWIVDYMVEVSRELGIGDEASLYASALRHCGALLYGRTASLDRETRRAVFALACDLIRRNRPAELYGLSFMERQLEDCLVRGDFARWELASRYL
jgi:glycosyltransferase involved in cell wall biosynthesis